MSYFIIDPDSDSDSEDILIIEQVRNAVFLDLLINKKQPIDFARLNFGLVSKLIDSYDKIFFDNELTKIQQKFHVLLKIQFLNQKGDNEMVDKKSGKSRILEHNLMGDFGNLKMLARWEKTSLNPPVRVNNNIYYHQWRLLINSNLFDQLNYFTTKMRVFPKLFAEQQLEKYIKDEYILLEQKHNTKIENLESNFENQDSEYSHDEITKMIQENNIIFDQKKSNLRTKKTRDFYQNLQIEDMVTSNTKMGSAMYLFESFLCSFVLQHTQPKRFLGSSRHPQIVRDDFNNVFNCWINSMQQTKNNMWISKFDPFKQLNRHDWVMCSSNNNTVTKPLDYPFDHGIVGQVVEIDPKRSIETPIFDKKGCPLMIEEKIYNHALYTNKKIYISNADDIPSSITNILTDEDNQPYYIDRQPSMIPATKKHQSLFDVNVTIQQRGIAGLFWNCSFKNAQKIVIDCF